MYTLQNDQLSVDVLDPIADVERFGTRYCTGGYIFQVTDAEKGPLLSGPTYPDSFNTFDGQGIPDAFNQSPLKDAKSSDTQALIIGIGLCDLEKNEVETFYPVVAMLHILPGHQAHHSCSTLQTA